MLRELHAAAGLVAVLCAGLVYCASAEALEWRSSHAASASANHDSNFGLSSIAAQRVRSSTVAASADVLARRPGLSFRLQPEVRAQRYLDDEQADRNDLFATFDLGLNNHRQSFGVGGRYANESTLTSEFEASGLLGIDVERVERGVNATYSRVLGSRGRFSAVASQVDTDYGETPQFTYGDFRVRSTQLTYTRATSEHTSWSLAARRLLSDDAQFTGDSATTSLSSSWSRQFSSQLSGSISVGVFVADTAEGEPEDPSGSLSLGLDRRWARWTFSASVGRDLRAQTVGELVVEDAVTLSTQRQVAERVSLGMELRGAHVTSVFQQWLDYSRTYSSVGARVNWQIARRFRLDASLYQRAEDTSFTDRATGLASVVSVTYRGG